MTIPEIQKYIRDIGLRPQKNAGQHFLWNEEVVERMVLAADVTARDTVLEIGPGFGILTQQLIATGAQVVVVELDRRLAAFLRRRFARAKNLTIVEGDIFHVRLLDYVTDRDYKIVANLPYSATSLVFRNFLTLPPRPTSMHVLIQKEVAARITAPVGSMSLLALSVQHYAQPAVLFDVPPKSFWPAPKVQSSVLACTEIHQSAGEPVAEMFRLARMGFAGRRKQLRNSLSAGLHQSTDKIDDLLLEAGIAPEARPQELSVENWLTLAKNNSYRA